MSIEQLIEDLDAESLDLCMRRLGYSAPEDTSEKCKRATILGDYEHGLISGKEIRAIFDDQHDKEIEARDRIIAAYNRTFAAIFAALEPETKTVAMRVMDEKM